MIKLGSLRFSVVRGYRGHDRRGLNRFGNGFGYRIGSTVFRFWKLRPNDYSDGHPIRERWNREQGKAA